MKSTPLKACAASAMAALALAAAPAAMADVVNGSFESGNFNGWTVTGNTGYTAVVDLLPHAGSFHAAFGEGLPGSSISQTVATVQGSSYQIRFWLELDDGATPNSFSLTLNGSPLVSFNNVAGFDYTEILSPRFLATGTSATIAFNFVNPQSYWLLDDITVSVPEPGRAALALAGLLLLFATRRLRSGRA